MASEGPGQDVVILPAQRVGGKGGVDEGLMSLVIHTYPKCQGGRETCTGMGSRYKGVGGGVGSSEHGK